MDTYRFESGSVYEFSKEYGAYVFIGKLNGQSKRDFIEECESL